MIHFTNINGERLPEDVNKIANERYDEDFCFKKPNESNELNIIFGFQWRKHIECYEVWYQVYFGNYEPLREFHRNNTEKPNS